MTLGKDYNVYAKWKKTLISVTLDDNYNGGKTKVVKEEFGTEYYVLQDIEPNPRRGYIFAGWAEDKNATKSSTGHITGPITLYAVWKLKDCQIKYYVGYGDGEAYSQYECTQKTESAFVDKAAAINNAQKSMKESRKKKKKEIK